MIEVAFNIIVVFIDHFANPSIVRQTTLTSSSIDKLNLRLVRASIYLSQFQLEVKYRLGKQHIIPNALSRLPATPIDTGTDINAFGALDIDTYHSGIEDLEVPDQVYAYQGTLVSMLAEFRQRLLDGYSKEKFWRGLLIMLSNLDKRTPQEQESQDPHQENINNEVVFKKFRIGIGFELRGGLVYYFGESNALRLCIPRLVEEEIFRVVHDDNHHSGYHRCLARIVDTLFVFGLLKKIRTYVENCLACQVNQTKRHRSYGELMPISLESHPFHIIVMDYVVGLSGKYDCLLTITDKFSRRLQLIPGYIIDFAVVWARRVLGRLQMADWGIP